MARLPAPRIGFDAAQASRVVRVSGLLDSDEVEAVLSLAISSKSKCGVHVRGRDAVSGQACWETTYLSTDFVFQKELPQLFDKLVNAALAVDAAEWRLCGGATLRARCVEHHRVLPGGALKHAEHYDSGSVVTIDVMLSNPEIDFQGGSFVATNVAKGDGAQNADAADADLPALSAAGDAVVFVSHKHHSVSPVTAGERRVLVIELWVGPARKCGHRCEDAFGDCAFRPVAANVLQSMDEQDDWDDETRAAALRFAKTCATPAF
ncbi:hypothetical protein M885DRAFT_513764 [Pelagophyceae sp. CCMP2097]|nr:hypothetical protein M885DRAFT_513764 [Pelagophyceae sp. CCMP2097]